MRTVLRLSNLILISLASVALAQTALAERREMAPHPAGEAVPRGEERPRGEAMPNVNGPDSKSRMEAEDRERVDRNRVDRQIDRRTPVGRVPMDDPNAVRRGEVDRREGARLRGCEWRGRGRAAGCAYYYDDDGEYYDTEGEPMPGWSPGEPMPAGAAQSQPESAATPAKSPGAAKIAPAPESDEHDQVYSPQGNDRVREELIAGRKNWLQKKSQLDDANAALARSEYQQQQTGQPVDPRLVAQQKQAEKEALAAHKALGPLVEKARNAGVSSELIDLYERANETD